MRWKWDDMSLMNDKRGKWGVGSVVHEGDEDQNLQGTAA